MFSGFFYIFHLVSIFLGCDDNLILLSSFCFLDFVPIDLDEWWAQRFLANIDKLS